MDNKELLSIKEVSEAANISQQAVYKQLNNKLKKYVVVVEGKKKLKKEVLEEVYNKKVEQKFNNNNSTVEQPIQPEIKIVLDTLQQQLKEKDKQIESLQASLNMAKSSLDQAQKLHLLDKQTILELQDKQKEAEEELNKPWFKRILKK